MCMILSRAEKKEEGRRKRERERVRDKERVIARVLDHVRLIAVQMLFYEPRHINLHVFCTTQ